MSATVGLNDPEVIQELQTLGFTIDTVVRLSGATGSTTKFLRWDQHRRRRGSLGLGRGRQRAQIVPVDFLFKYITAAAPYLVVTVAGSVGAAAMQRFIIAPNRLPRRANAAILPPIETSRGFR